MGMIKLTLRSLIFLFSLFSLTSFALEPPPGFNGAPDASPNAAEPVNSGRFVGLTRGLSSLGDTPGATINLSIRIPNDGTESDIHIFMFDGDLDNTWDSAPIDTLSFTLYPDPDLVANTSGPSLATVDASTLSDNDWSELFAGPLALPNEALSDDGQFFNFHLVGEWGNPALIINQNNLFKVASNGEIFLLPGSSIGFIGLGPIDPAFPPTAYDGRITFDLVIPEP